MSARTFFFACLFSFPLWVMLACAIARQWQVVGTLGFAYAVTAVVLVWIVRMDCEDAVSGAPIELDEEAAVNAARRMTFDAHAETAMRMLGDKGAVR